VGNKSEIPDLNFTTPPLISALVSPLPKPSFPYEIQWRASERVPRLLIRDCVASPNNRGPRRPKLGAIDVTAKTFFERSYLVPGLHQFAPFVIMPSAPTSYCSFYNFFSISVQFFPEWPQNLFCQHNSPSNLAESQYPRASCVAA